MNVSEIWFRLSSRVDSSRAKQIRKFGKLNFETASDVSITFPEKENDINTNEFLFQLTKLI